MGAEHMHVWIGLAGDAMTFLGGAILALDAVNQEKEAQRIRRISRTIESPGFKKLLIEIDGATIKGEKDVEAAFLHRSARIAKRGFVILNVGFLLLIASRLTELYH
jgi:hypothetical protein